MVLEDRQFISHCADNVNRGTRSDNTSVCCSGMNAPTPASILSFNLGDLLGRGVKSKVASQLFADFRYLEQAVTHGTPGHCLIDIYL